MPKFKISNSNSYKYKSYTTKALGIWQGAFSNKGNQYSFDNLIQPLNQNYNEEALLNCYIEFFKTDKVIQVFKNLTGNQKVELLSTALNTKYFTIFEFFISQSIDIDTQGENGTSVLYNACFDGAIEIVEYLLSYTNIDINLGSQELGTPLYIATQKNHQLVINKLLQEGACLFGTIINNYNYESEVDYLLQDQPISNLCKRQYTNNVSDFESEVQLFSNVIKKANSNEYANYNYKTKELLNLEFESSFSNEKDSKQYNSMDEIQFLVGTDLS